MLHERGCVHAHARLVLFSVVRRPVGRFALRPPTVVYRSLDYCEAEVLSARQRSGAPPISYPLKPAQAMNLKRHPVRPAQRQTAILEGNENMLATFIAAESMRREAHSELDVGAGQADAALDRPPDQVGGRGGSFPRHLLDPEDPLPTRTTHNHRAY